MVCQTLIQTTGAEIAVPSIESLNDACSSKQCTESTSTARESYCWHLARSGSKSGYLKSVDVRDRRTDSFEDVIAMENMKSKIEGGQQQGVGLRYEDSEDEEKGILFSTTVEITRDARRSRGDDMV